MSRRTFHRAGENERRQDLLTATLDCVAEFGLHGATVRRIAERAGVTAGLIRHYFSGKDQMLQASYRETMAAMHTAAISATEAAGEDPRTRLHDFIIANLSPPVTDPRTMSLWAAFISHVRVDPSFAEIHRETYLDFLGALEGLIAAFLGANGRQTSPEECHELAIAISGLIDGLWLEGSLAGDLFDDRALPRIALKSVEAILGGLSLSHAD